MFTPNSRGERRVSPSTYKLLLTSHVGTSVGWLGVVFAKLVLGLLAIATNAPELLPAMDALNVAFPPLAIAALLTGVLLSLGTRWGVFDHYWIVVKLVLTFGVIATAVQITSRLTQAALADPAGPARSALLALTLVHLVMLAVATVLSVYKPWGRIQIGQRIVARLATAR